MAVRLTVVLSQVRGGSSQQQEREANLIAALIGRPGIDVSLIGGLDEIAQSATDRLVLEGLSGDFALVAWQAAADAFSALEGLAIAGSRAPHAGDPEVARQPGRRVYCFDAGGYADADSLVAALADLLATRQVKTVSLASPSSLLPVGNGDVASTAPATRRPSAVASEEASGGRPTPPQDVRSGPGKPIAEPTASRGDETPRPAESASAASRRSDRVTDREADREAQAQDARLDALVDDLNLLDL